MSEPDSVLFIDYATTTKLLSVPDAMAICEDVFRMHARNTVKWSAPPSQKLDVGAPFHNHWHVKTVMLAHVPEKWEPVFRKGHAPTNESRAHPAAKWSKTLGIPVRPLATVEEVVRSADLAIGSTTRTDIVSREPSQVAEPVFGPARPHARLVVGRRPHSGRKAFTTPLRTARVLP